MKTTSDNICKIPGQFEDFIDAASKLGDGPISKFADAIIRDDGAPEPFPSILQSAEDERRRALKMKVEPKITRPDLQTTGEKIPYFGHMRRK